MAAQALGGDISKGNDQIGFPAVYQSVYSAAKLPVRMMPREYVPITEPFVGTDFQARYHEQKKRDADHMSRAKVQATQQAKVRAFSSHAGYFGMPKPVLGQRKFANPAMGAFSAVSARRDGHDAPFSTVETGYSGGVLRSAEGQAHGKARLLDRINQLNRIEAAKQSFQLTTLGGPTAAPTGAPMAQLGPAAATTTALPQDVGESTKIELNLLLQGIIDALMSGQPRPGEGDALVQVDTLSRFTFADSTRALTILFRLAPSASAEDLEDVLEKVQTIRQLLDSILDPDRIEQQPEAVQSALTTKILFDKVADYIEQMSSPNNINLSPTNRLLLSQALVKSLGFAQYLRRPDLQRLAQTAPAAGERAAAEDAEADEDGDDDDGFDESARPREDDEEDDRDYADFDYDDRQTFGYASGSYFGEAPGGSDGYSVNPFSREARGRNIAFPGGEAVAAVPAREPGLRAFYDEDTGSYNVAAPASSSGAPSVLSPSERARADRAEAAAGPAAAPAANPVVRRALRPPPPPSVSSASSEGFPKSKDDLPSSRSPGALAQYDALAKRINAMPADKRPTLDKGTIQVYAGSKAANVRANFIKRLGL